MIQLMFWNCGRAHLLGLMKQYDYTLFKRKNISGKQNDKNKWKMTKLKCSNSILHQEPICSDTFKLWLFCQGLRKHDSTIAGLNCHIHEPRTMWSCLLLRECNIPHFNLSWSDVEARITFLEMSSCLYISSIKL